MIEIPTETVAVRECYHACPFFDLDGGPGAIMFCNHPLKGYMDGMIISHENSHDRVPDECPLRKDNVKKTQIICLVG
jgi:hypothetical protein